MNKANERTVDDSYKAEHRLDNAHQATEAGDSADFDPDDVRQQANPAAAEKATGDQDPHNVAKSNKQFDSELMKNDKQL